MKIKKPNKISKSTKYYLIFGVSAVGFVIALFVIYALITGIDLLAWFSFDNKRFVMVLLLAFIYSAIGLSLFVKDIIRRM